MKEKSEGGSVPELIAVNSGPLPILLLDGEALVGAKQNRVLNASILIAGSPDPEGSRPGGTSELMIPVSCVEQGRWSYESVQFTGGKATLPARARAKKSMAVTRSLKESDRYRADQGEVWDEVARISAAAKVHSPTAALSDVYASKEEDLKATLAEVKVQDGQSGFLAQVGGEILGGDFISRPKALRKVHQKLLRGYAIESLDKLSDSTKVTFKNPKDLLNEAITAEKSVFRSVGLGYDVRIEGKTVTGSALVVDDAVIHLNLFRRAEDQGLIAPPVQRFR